MEIDDLTRFRLEGEDQIGRLKAYKVVPGPVGTEESYLVFAVGDRRARMGFCRLVSWANEFDWEHPCYISSRARRAPQYDKMAKVFFDNPEGWRGIQEYGQISALVPPENLLFAWGFYEDPHPSWCSMRIKEMPIYRNVCFALLAGLVTGSSYCKAPYGSENTSSCPHFVGEVQNV